MAYEDRFGITDIRDQNCDNLSISVDTCQEAEGGPIETIAVLLYTPSMDNTNEHFHIPLTVDQAKVMAEWLDKFVKEHGNVSST